MQKQQVEPTKEFAEITTVKLSRAVREHIARKARWDESVDDTLRRLIGLKPKEEAAK